MTQYVVRSSVIARHGHRRVLWAAVALMFTSACGSLIDNAVSGMSSNLTKSMMDQDDPETVRQAAPAYLLMLDSFVQGDPDNPGMLNGAAALYSAYGSVFVDEPVRAQRLTARAWVYAQKAFCIEYEQGCELRTKAFDDWLAFLSERDDDDAEAMFSLATSWLSYVQAHSGDFSALADLPKAEALLNRLAEVNDGYEQANIMLYLGVLNSIRPPGLGGNPERGKTYFEKALALNAGTDLSVKVSYARFYARTLYERELHDKLLNEVIEADPTQGPSTLLNVMAQEEALRLLASADDYF